MTGCFSESLRSRLLGADATSDVHAVAGFVLLSTVTVLLSELLIEFRPWQLSNLLEALVFDCIRLPCK